MRNLIVLLFVLCIFSACNTIPGVSAGNPYQGESAFTLNQMGLFTQQEEPPSGQAEKATSDEPEPEAVVPEEAEPEKDEKHSILVHVLLYIPNRVFDLFDIARAGVSVGLGIGVDLTATEYLNATLMTKASVGVGFQTLRHLPIEAASYAMVGLGPLKASADPGLSWYRSPGDIRVEFHALLVGAHAAVEIFEIVDFIVGFIFLDPKDDDF